MLTTVEAEVDANGNVRLLEPLKVVRTTRAVLTLLEEVEGSKGNADEIRAFFETPEFRNRKSYPAEEIDAQIEETRNSWE